MSGTDINEQEYQKLAATIANRAEEMELLTDDITPLLDLDQLKDHPGAIRTDRTTGLGDTVSHAIWQLGVLMCVLVHEQ